MKCAAALTVALFVAVALLFAGTSMDDPFIYARYARNLLELHSVVFSAGGPRVEGVSSWLWTLVYAAGEALGLPPLALPRGLGIALGALLVASVVRQILKRGTGVSAWVALVFLATAVDLAFYASCGMDHVLWALVAWLFLIHVGTAKRVERRHYLLAALGFFVRPEGFLLFIPVFARQLVDERRETSARAAGVRILATASPGLALHAGFIGLRWMVFGRLLPNAAAAKHLGGPMMGRLFDGLVYLGAGLQLYAMPVAVALAVAIVAPPSRDEEQVGIPAVAFVLASLGMILLGGGDDFSAFGDTRLITPLIGPLTLLFVLALRGVETRPMPWLRASALIVALCSIRLPKALALLKWSTAANNLSTPTQVFTGWVQGFRSQAPMPLSVYLLRVTPKEELIAVPWAGRVPFETNLRTIDLLGLNDPHIATVQATERGVDVRYDASYVLAARPYFICENFKVRGSLEDVARASDGELRRSGAIKLGQVALLRNPDLARFYEIDPEAPLEGTCLVRRPPRGSLEQPSPE